MPQSIVPTELDVQAIDKLLPYLEYLHLYAFKHEREFLKKFATLDPYKLYGVSFTCKCVIIRYMDGYRDTKSTSVGIKDYMEWIESRAIPYDVVSL